MKDSYSLDLDARGMERQYDAHHRAYDAIYQRCGLPVVSVGSDMGMMGGSVADEFMYRNSIGEDTLITCSECGYAANRQIAVHRGDVRNSGDALPLQKIHTPGTKTIEDLAVFLDVPKHRLAKAVFMVATIADGEETSEKFILVMIRGDLEVNETKLSNTVKALALRPATDDEIRARGIEPGYGSPIGARDTMVVADDTVSGETNMFVGANEEGYHFSNVNLNRDFRADIVGDIAYAEEGFPCVSCGSPLTANRGIEVGNIFQLGTRYSDSMNCFYLDNTGNQRPVYMGSYGIGIGRLLACLVEEYHDEHGIIWPPQVAPHQIHLINLSSDRSHADRQYDRFTEKGWDVLYDDRDERAGVKFNDADLIGVPIRFTVGDRVLAQGNAEVKLRWENDTRLIPLADVETRMAETLETLESTFRERFPLNQQGDRRDRYQRY